MTRLNLYPSNITVFRLAVFLLINWLIVNKFALLSSMKRFFITENMIETEKRGQTIPVKERGDEGREGKERVRRKENRFAEERSGSWMN